MIPSFLTHPATAVVRGLVVVALAITTLLGSSAPAAAMAVYQLPIVSAGEATWIVDDAGIISRINENNIAKRMNALYQGTGQEARLVTIHHFDYGETVQSFTDKLFERWYPDAEQQASQVLVVLDEVTKTVGIRVGDAAATLLDASTADSVAQETILYPLLEGDKYNQAFLAATDRLVAVLSGDPDPGPPAFDDSFESESEGTFASAEETQENRNTTTIVVVVLLLLATIIPMATYYAYVGFGN